MSREYVFTVYRLTRYIKALLAQDTSLQSVVVQGEIADFVRHSSGHIYFTLKDDCAQLRCVIFREEASTLDFRPESGMEVAARGAVTVYESRGQYQLIVRQLERVGVGDLHRAFERLRRQLAAEGLFDETRKRSLPPFPRRIAVLTSPVGAAVHDVLVTLHARWPAADVILIPTSVSGPASAPSIVQSIERLRLIEDLDLAMLVRGGGSFEELAGFNAESVARAIAAAPVPVVTGIGHETDFTIADFVADHRAPTPTGAALTVTPDRSAITERVRSFRRALADQLHRVFTRDRRELRLLQARPVLRQPRSLLVERRQRLDDMLDVQRRSIPAFTQRLFERFQRAAEKLAVLRPEAVLARGYSITHLPDGTIVRSVQQVRAGDRAEITFSDGSAHVTVEKAIIPTRRRANRG